MQKFIGQSEWDDRPLLTELVRQVGMELGETDGVLVFDPSAFPKEGACTLGDALKLLTPAVVREALTVGCRQRVADDTDMCSGSYRKLFHLGVVLTFRGRFADGRILSRPTSIHSPAPHGHAMGASKTGA